MLMDTGFDGCGYGYLWVVWVPKPVWVWTMGSMIFEAARRKTLPVALIHVFRRGREGTTLPIALSCICQHGREGEILPVISVRVF